MNLKNHLEKNSIKKIENTENQSEIAACEQNQQRFFVQTPFSHSTLKLERKYSRRKSTSFFGVTKMSRWEGDL